MNEKKSMNQEKVVVDYVSEVYKLIEKNGISAYGYSLTAVGSQTPEKLSSAEIRFKNHSLEAMEENVRLLAEAGIKIVDYNPDITDDHFLVYGRPGPLNKVRKSEAIAEFDLINLEHGPTMMFKKK